jgi:hypothetical protein
LVDLQPEMARPPPHGHGDRLLGDAKAVAMLKAFRDIKAA